MKNIRSILVVGICTLSFLFFFQGESRAKELKIGFLYVSPISDAGWTYSHDIARREIETISGLTVKFIESVDEGIQSEPILEYFAKNKYDLIFATSYGYMDPVIKIAKMYPNVIFMHCSGFKRSKNVGTYFGRMYQPRYLTGMVAGAMTKSNLIGYVAAYPIPEVIRGINAFTLGVKSENPDAEVHVIWTKTWYDPLKEKSAATTLLNKGVDVITQHQDSPATQVAAQKRNVYSIGYHTDMSKFAPDVHLTSSVWNWKVIYKYIVDQVRDGTWKSQDIWWGMEKDAVDIAPISNKVPKNIREKVQAKRQELIKDQFGVFEGPIKDQKGTVRIPAGEKATDEQLLNMKWFVNGVKGKIE